LHEKMRLAESATVSNFECLKALSVGVVVVLVAFLAVYFVFISTSSCL